MPLIPWRPFLEEWDEWFNGGVSTPRTDLYETEKDVVAEIELPGVDPKDISVEVENNALRVEAKHEERKEEKKKGYYKKEISSGYYKRVLPLPVEVKDEKAEATYEQGILKVVVPKAAPKKKVEKKVKVNVKTKAKK